MNLYAQPLMFIKKVKEGHCLKGTKEGVISFPSGLPKDLATKLSLGLETRYGMLGAGAVQGRGRRGEGCRAIEFDVRSMLPAEVGRTSSPFLTGQQMTQCRCPPSPMEMTLF